MFSDTLKASFTCMNITNIHVTIKTTLLVQNWDNTVLKNHRGPGPE